MYRRIVLAADGSPASDQAVRTCAELAKVLQATVTVVHATADPLMLVPPVAPAGGMVAPPVIPEETLQEMEQAGREVLQRAAQTLASAGVPHESKLVQGGAGQKIVDACKKSGADLVVLGSRGHSKLEELLLGSVSDTVARQAPCSVLIVR